MKRILIIFAIAALGAGAAWFLHQNTLSAATPAAAPAPERKILYYQSPMHPWIKSDKPGKCPICGMNLVPVYASNDSTNTASGLKLDANSINIANIQIVPVEPRQLTRSVRVAGTIDMSGPSYFVFTAYERDFIWLDVGQQVEVTFPAMPGKIFHAKITRFDTRFVDPSRADFTHGIQIRAKFSDSLAHVPGVNRWRPFDGFYAEGRVVVDVPDVLAIPRSAILSPDGDPFVYVYNGGGHYERRKITLGRIGDDDAEVTDGLKEQEKVVTSGNLLIDAEAQISQTADN